MHPRTQLVQNLFTFHVLMPILINQNVVLNQMCESTLGELQSTVTICGCLIKAFTKTMFNPSLKLNSYPLFSSTASPFSGSQATDLPEIREVKVYTRYFISSLELCQRRNNIIDGPWHLKAICWAHTPSLVFLDN